jgi:predicted CxxxxCH...CXXCH cytochrome family protein
MNPQSPSFHAAAANAGLADCAACHGESLDGGIAPPCATCHDRPGVSWKTSCTMCHGGTDNMTGAPPKATWGRGADAVRIGAHTTHVARYACATCHVTPTSALDAAHVDGPVATVTFGGLASAGGTTPIFDRASATCASTWCHGASLAGGTNTAPTWTSVGTGEAACGACHGAPPPAPHPASGLTGCVTCHAESVDAAGNPKPAPLGAHLDGAVTGGGHEAAWVDPASSAFHAFSANQGLAACAACHGETLDGGTASACARCHDENLPAGVASWKVSCVMCHGGTNDTTGAPPETTWGNAADTVRTGAHASHLAAGVACAWCHVVPADALAAGHVDSASFADVALPGVVGGPVPAWDRATATCTSTSCHAGAGGSVPSPVWTRVGEGQAACGACHGLPPAVGGHERHLTGGSIRNAVACGECHAVPAPDATGHADGEVQLVFGPLARTDGSPATWDPANLTCTNYCHGAILRGGGTNLDPSWTGGASETACGSCHGTPPPAPHPHTQICDNCHPGYTTTSVNLEKHINGVVEADNLTCSSCHGDNSRVLVMQADPLAIASPPYGSRGETDPTSRSVGQHEAHVSRGDGIALPNKCRYCHAVPATGANDHANGASEVTFDSLATMDGATPDFDATTATCTNTYCHGATLGRGGTDHSPSWTNPIEVTCTSCHGSPPPAPHPQDSSCLRCHPGYTATTVRKWTHVNGISDFPTGCNSCHDTPPSSGEHYEHLHERISCSKCHAGYTATTENPALHRNARQDVTLSGWNASRRTCSNISCHGSEYWGRTGEAARQSCNQCHGVPPRSGEHEEHSEYSCSRCHGSGFTTTTTNGTLHMNGVSDVPFTFYDRTSRTCSGTSCHGSESWGSPRPVTPLCGNCHGFPPRLPHPQQSACQTCHPSMSSAGVLTVAHNDGTLDITGAGCATCHGSPPAKTRAGGVHPANANCYGCHSTTVDATNQVTPNGTHNDGHVQVGGGGVGTYGCQSCHGDPSRSVPAGTDPHAKSAPPLGTLGESEPTTRAVGAHLAHVAKGANAIARPAACAECHVVPTAMDHATGDVVMAFGGRSAAGGAAPRWNTADLTCSSTYCHGATLGAGGTNTAPSWVGGPAEGTCGTCHGSPPPAPHTASTSCGGCHDGYTATTVNVAEHVDGHVDVATSTCNDCHGDAVNAAPPTGTHGETLTTQRAVGAHQAHLADGALAKAFACAECHVVPASMTHVDGTARLDFGAIARTGGTPASFDSTTLTCSTYCHGATLAAGGTNTAPLWTKVDGSQVACGSCHAVPPPAPHSSNPSCGGCHDGYTSTSVNVAIHVNGRAEIGSLTCSSCHGSAVNAAPPAGVDGDTSTSTIAVGAHQQHLQGGAVSRPIACSECHAVPTTMGHADAQAQVAFGELATAAGAAPGWNRTTASCSATYCHGQFVGGNLFNEPSWTTVNGTQASCGSCHGSPPPAPHVQSAECDVCHAGYTPSSVNLATHVDGRLDITPNTCTVCHGSGTNAAPPNGTNGETSETARAVGAHQRHLSGGPLRGPVACTECHAVPTTIDHVNGAVQLVFGALASTDGALPTFDAVNLTCSNYCHGAVLRGGGTNLAPVWTGGASQVTCGSCHGAPPPAPHPRTQICDNCHPGYTLTSVNPATHVNGLVEAENLTCSSCHGDNSRVLVMQSDPLAIAAPPFGSRGETSTTSRSVGQHQAHVSRGDGIALPNKCRYCHAVPAPDAFDHANGTSEVSFGSLAAVDGAIPAFDHATNTCSNTYCHGSTLGRGGTDHSPSWTDPTPVTCTTCHGSPPPPPHPQDSDCLRCHPGYTATTVRKTTHVNGFSDFPSGCNSCHDTPPSSGEHYEHLHGGVSCSKCHAGYTATTENPALHRNARQDVTLSGWNASQRTCSNIGCHGGEYWGRTGQAARQSCNQCHGVPPNSGEHFEHSEYACSRCHGTGYSTTTTSATTHMNGVADVPFGFYNRSTRTCSSTGCHSSEHWGTVKPVTPSCANCHGFPPSLPHPQQSTCQSCHPSMLATGVLTAEHNDGSLDLSGVGCTSCHGAPPTSTRVGGVHPADENCYGCHSTTVSAANEVVANGTHNDGYVQIGGGGVGTYGCQSCHGDQAREALAGTDPNAKSAPPLGTRGETETTTRAVGAHLAHVNEGAGALAAPALCVDCHVVPTGMDHAMGTVLMAFGPRATTDGAIALWDAENLTCSSYCHGSTLGAGGTNHLPSWTGGPAEAACGTCHGAPPPAPHTANPSCGACHQGYTPTTVNVATHVDGLVQSWSHADGYASAAQHGRDANLQGFASCASCHGSDLDGGTTGVSCNACHTTAGFSAWLTDCTFCHGDRATGAQSPPLDVQGRGEATNVSVGVHGSHVATTLATPLSCTACHAARTGSILTDAEHVDGDGIAEVVFGAVARTGGAAATYTRASGTSASCATTYCHGAFAGGLSATMEWTSTEQVGCTSCHGSPPPAPHPANTGCGTCHAGYTQTTVNRATHVDGILQVTSNHVAGYADRTKHGYEVNLTGLASCKGCHGADLSGASGRACSSCHAAAGIASWDTSCTFCHGTVSTGRASPPVDIRGRTVATNVSVGVHASHVGTTIATAVACVQCHPAHTTSVITDATHVDGNGLAEVVFGTVAKTGGALPKYTRTSATSATCANVYCHGKFSGGANSGQGATVSWTSTTQVGCTSCHGRPPSTGDHGKHSGRSCGDCHGVGYTTSAVVKATHLDGIEQVGNRVSSYDRATRSCTTSCHSRETW